jgi:chromosome condensin MukBEF complex kleisin-like MukF subunit
MGQYVWKALHQTAEAHSAAGNNSTHLDLEVGYKLPHNKFSTTNITSSKNTSLTNIKRKKIEKYITAAWHRSQARSIFLHMYKNSIPSADIAFIYRIKSVQKKKKR